MDVNEALTRGRARMDEWRLHDWTLELRRSRRRIGVCYYRDRLIGLSRAFVEMNDWDTVEQTVLHEIAHALVGVGHGHDSVWVDMAFSVGVREPSSRSRGTQQIPGRYRSVCGTCGVVGYRHQRVRPNRAGIMPVFHCKPCWVDRRHVSPMIFEDTVLTTEPKTRTVLTSTPRREPTMSDTLSAPELAKQIGTDPKTLRRFLRENDSFRNPGSGKRYEFTQKEAVSVEKAFRAWAGQRRPRNTQTTGESRAKGKSTESKRARQIAARERVDALEASLRASGKHISQREKS